MGLAWYLMKPWMKPVHRGALCCVKLGMDPALNEVSGKYFDSDGSEKTPNQQAYDTDLRKKLWQVSAELTGLSG
jgi:hypothetical protein